MKTFRLGWLVALLFVGNLTGSAATVPLLTITNAWRYNSNNLDAASWAATNYDDSAWAVPSNALFYIESATLPAPKNTLLPGRSGGGPMLCYYFRTTFVFTNNPLGVSLAFTNLIDDGAVFYLNGAEIQRVRMGVGPVVYTNLTTAQPPGGDAGAFEGFTVSPTNLVPGTNTLAVRVHQSAASSTDIVFGAAVTATVPDNFSPVVALTNPLDGAVFLLGSNVALAANASDYDGTVTKVEFYDGATKLGEDLTNPYSFVWSNAALGPHTLTVVATDNTNGVTTSAAVSISVIQPPPPQVTRGPYLQSATPTSLVIRWRTDQATNSRVVFGTNLAQLNVTNFDAAVDVDHRVSLSNLVPATKYYYAVGHAASNLAGATTNFFFITPPPVGTPKPSRIWVIGDAGTADGNQTNVRNAYYTFVMTNLFNGTNHTDLWLQLGDNAYNAGTDAEYQEGVFDAYTNLLRQSVTWPCLGNHDTAQSNLFTNTYPYFDIFTLPTNGEAGGVASGFEQFYSFDYANIHFVSLDSMTADLSTNGLMAQWLRLDLQANTQQWLIAFFHHPPYTKGTHDSDNIADSGGRMRDMRTNFLPILENYGVDLVLSGHSHVYERSKFIDGHYDYTTNFSSTNVVQAGSGRETNGVGAYAKPRGYGQPRRGTVYVVAGSSGQPGSGTTNHPAMFLSLTNLASLVLDVNGNRLDATTLGHTTNLVLDRFTLLKTNTPPVASNRVFSVGGYTATNLALAGSDLNRDALTFATAALPTNGLLSAFNTNNGSFTYTPARGATNGDVFTFLVSDGTTNSASATVTMSYLAFADTNANGLADWWEAQFGVTNPSADPDGDGQTNLQEFWAGTDPASVLSWLRVTNIAGAGGGFAVSWPSIGGVRYRVSYSNGDAQGHFNGAFTPVVRPVALEMDSAAPGAASTQTFTDDYSLTGGAPPQGRRYYRVEAVR